MAQASFTADPRVALPGLKADHGLTDEISTIVGEAAGIEPGLFVVRGGTGDERPPIAALPGGTGGVMVADVDAIVTAHATAAAPQVLTVADANGVIGDDEISPPKKLTFVMNSHADWNATSGDITYEDENGVQVTETLTIPDGGNATLTTAGYATRFIGATVPAQAGTNGSYTIGTSATATLAGTEVLGVSVRTHHARLDLAASGLDTYEDETSMPVMRRGRIWMVIENDFKAGDRVLARVIAAGAEKLGAARVGTTDSGDAFQVPGAQLMTSGSAGDLGIVELNLTR
jgi:hypothetical protein